MLNLQTRTFIALLLCLKTFVCATFSRENVLDTVNAINICYIPDMAYEMQQFYDVFFGEHSVNNAYNLLYLCHKIVNDIWLLSSCYFIILR